MPSGEGDRTARKPPAPRSRAKPWRTTLLSRRSSACCWLDVALDRTANLLCDQLFRRVDLHDRLELRLRLFRGGGWGAAARPGISEVAVLERHARLLELLPVKRARQELPGEGRE